jgi:hypothetical protein
MKMITPVKHIYVKNENNTFESCFFSFYLLKYFNINLLKNYTVHLTLSLDNGYKSIIIKNNLDQIIHTLNNFSLTNEEYEDNFLIISIETKNNLDLKRIFYTYLDKSLPTMIDDIIFFNNIVINNDDDIKFLIYLNESNETNNKSHIKTFIMKYKDIKNEDVNNIYKSEFFQRIKKIDK